MNYDEITVEAWFYRDTKCGNTGNDADSIFGAWRWASNNQESAEFQQHQQGFDLRFFKNNPDILQWIVVTQDAQGHKTETVAEFNMVEDNLNKWYHVAATYDKTSGDLKLYIDGALRVTEHGVAGNTIVPLTEYSDMRIGHSRVNNGYFDGMIDNVAIYNRALSDTEVGSNFTGLAARSSNGLAAYYTFDDGTAFDSSGNENHLTLASETHPPAITQIAATAGNLPPGRDIELTTTRAGITYDLKGRLSGYTEETSSAATPNLVTVTSRADILYDRKGQMVGYADTVNEASILAMNGSSDYKIETKNVQNIEKWHLNADVKTAGLVMTVIVVEIGRASCRERV